MTIRAVFLQPLGPALVLALGGLVLWLSYRVGPQPVPYLASRSPRSGGFRVSLPFRALFALFVVGAAAILLLLLRTPAARPALQRAWQPLTVAGTTLSWQLDGWNWLVCGIVLLLTTVALAVGHTGFSAQPLEDRTQGSVEWTLWAGAAALLFVMSGNVVTLASGWVLFDAALVLRLRPGGSAEPAGRAWMWLSITGLLMLVVLAVLGERGVRVALTDPALGRFDLAVLWVAALVRAGVYPFHIWLIGPGSVDRGGRAVLHLIAPTTGLWLLARVHEGIGPGWFRRPEWAALGVFALLGTALGAWTVEDEERRWRWIALNRASLVVMAAYAAEASGPAALVWPVATFSLGCALLVLGQAIRTSNGWSWPLWVGALALWGVPGTAGFLTRFVLVFPTELEFAIPLFLVMVIAEVLLVAALWQMATGRKSGRQPNASEPGDTAPLTRFALAEMLLVVILVAVPLVLGGIFPHRLTPLDIAHPALLDTMTHARRSVWIGLLVSGVGGVVLGLLRERIFSRMRGWQSVIAGVVGLDWLYRGIAGGFMLFGNGLRYFADLGEGEGYIGWLLLAALILWVLLRA